MGKQDKFQFGSAVSRDGQPLLWTKWGKNEGHMTTEQAKSLGMSIIASAVEAECDAATFHGLQAMTAGVIDEKAAEQMTQNVRLFRERSRGNRTGTLDITATGEAVPAEGVTLATV